jgi:hypothetical protein
MKKIEIIGQGDLNSKSNLLYEEIIVGNIKTDEDALKRLYKSVSPKLAAQNLKKIKQRLKKKLLNSIYFIDLTKESYDDAAKTYYECYKNWTTFKLLSLKGNLGKISYNLAEKTLQKTLKYEVTDIAVLLARELRLYHSIVTGNQKKFEKYNDVFDKQSKLLDAEFTAEKYYSQLIMLVTIGRGKDQSELISKCNEYIPALNKLEKNYNSYRFYRTSFYVKALAYEIKGDYQNIIVESEKALTYFKSKSFSTPAAIFGVKSKLIIAMIPLKRFSEAKKLAEENMNTIKQNEYNWFVNLYYYIILCIHSKDYEKAFKFISYVKNLKAFKTLYSHLKQNFVVFDAYLNFLVERNKITGLDQEEQKNKFRIYKFLNDVPIFTKDKRGLNIAILIVHVLFLLHLKKYNQIIDRVETLNQYCYRYLRKDDTFRSNCFIKMLLQIPKADFNRIRTERYAEKYVDKLNSVPLSVSTQSAEVEFFPYEDLWEITLEMLD